MRLLNAEITRLSKRRLTWLVLSGMLLFVALMVASTFLSTREPSADELAQQQLSYQEAVMDWETNGHQMQLDCEEAEARTRAENPTVEINYGCDHMGPPQEEWYVYQPPVLADQLRHLGEGSFEVFAMAALVLGAGFVGAEFVSGSMSTWLTFEPRRNRVFVTKLTAAGLGVASAALLSYVLLALGTTVVCAINGEGLSLTTEQFWDFCLPVLRSWAIVTGIGIASASLAFALRHTAAAISFGLGSVFLVDAMLLQIKPKFTPLGLLPNSHAVIDGPYNYSYWTCGGGVSETSCTTVEKVIEGPQAVGYLIAVFTLAIMVGFVMFRKRDVN